MLQLFGRQILDYFLQEGIKDVVDDPSLPLPDRVDQATATRFLELLVDFRVAMVGTCLDSNLHRLMSSKQFIIFNATQQVVDDKADDVN